MKLINHLRQMACVLGLTLATLVAATSAPIDVPVGEPAAPATSPAKAVKAETQSAPSTPVVTNVVESDEPLVVPAPEERRAQAAPARPSQRTTSTRATRSAPAPLQGRIGGASSEGQVRPLMPDLASITPSEGLNPDDRQLVATTQPGGSVAVASADGDPINTSGSDPAAPSERVKEVAVFVIDWELSEIVQSITAQTGVNIVLASTSNPKITVRLERMPVKEVVRIIASLSGMQVVQLKSGGYVIAPGDVLRNAFPQEYQEQIAAIQERQNATSPNGQTVATTAPSAPVVTHVATYDVRNVNAQELAEALNTVFELDGLIVRIGPSKLLPSSLNGESGGSGNSQGGLGGRDSAGSPSGNSSGRTGSTARTLVLRGPRSIVDGALQLAEQLDVKQAQVAIRVQIHDINNEALRDLGIDWQDSTGTTITERPGSDINFGSFRRNALSFQATLRHLESTERAKLLAQPNISVLDQESAYILIGDRLQFPVVTSINDAGQPVFDVREERVGIYLQVSATVNNKNDVTLNLYPQVSAVTGFLEVPGQGSYPQISTREARTSIRVRSGSPVVIGGLIRDEEIRTVERVPLLGQIPIFGELFTRRKTTKNQSQVVISVTPQIIENEP